MNKQQQILSYIQSKNEKLSSSDYTSRTSDEEAVSDKSQTCSGGNRTLQQRKLIITAHDWRLLLKESQSMEIIDIWLMKKVPSIQLSPPQSSQANEMSQHEQTRSSASNAIAIEKILAQPFFAWPVIDEAGELDDKVSLPDRVSRFVNAIYLELPIRKINEELPRTPIVAVDQSLGPTFVVDIDYKTLARIQEKFVNPRAGRDILKLIDNLTIILRLFLPPDYSTADYSHALVQLYWGAAYEIIEV